METEWRDFSLELETLLDLEDKPIAVTLTNDPVESDGRKASFCQAVKMAARGKTFVLDKETSACPGGSWHCGLSEPPSGDFRRVLQKFLTRGEKLSYSLSSLWRMMELTPGAPTGISERIVICPMEESGLRPDLAVFTCDGEQACRLLTLDQFWDGIPPRVQTSGSLCYSVIAYPVVTGQTNVSFGDWTARRSTGFREDAVFLTVPFERMQNLVKAIPECSAGTAEFHMPPEMREASGSPPDSE